MERSPNWTVCTAKATRSERPAPWPRAVAIVHVAEGQGAERRCAGYVRGRAERHRLLAGELARVFQHRSFNRVALHRALDRIPFAVRIRAVAARADRTGRVRSRRAGGSSGPWGRGGGSTPVRAPARHLADGGRDGWNRRGETARPGKGRRWVRSGSSRETLFAAPCLASRRPGRAGWRRGLGILADVAGARRTGSSLERFQRSSRSADVEFAVANATPGQLTRLRHTSGVASVAVLRAFGLTVPRAPTSTTSAFPSTRCSAPTSTVIASSPAGHRIRVSPTR